LVMDQGNIIESGDSETIRRSKHLFLSSYIKI
jgi:hypothetical protein